MATLLKAISSSDTTLMFTGEVNFPQDDGVIQIGSEIIIYSTIYMNTMYGCIRGAESTTAASHAINSPIVLKDFYSAISNIPETFSSVTITGLTASTAIFADSTKTLASSSTTDVELSYVHGVTSAIQTQLNAKKTIATGNNYKWETTGATGLLQETTVTASKAVATDSNGLPTASTTTATELGYVAGVTSAIQAQLDTKLTSSTGVTDVHADANAAIHGSVQLISGAGIALTQSGQGITIATSGGGSPGGSQYDIQTNDGAGGFVGSGSVPFQYNGTTVGLGIDNPLQRLTIAGTTSVSNPKIGYFSTDNILLSALDGGVYLGHIGVKETPLALRNYGAVFTPSNSGAVSAQRIAVSSNGRIQFVSIGNGNFYTSHDYGDTWINYFQGGGYSLTEIAMSADGKYVIAAGGVGAGYWILSSDYGITFDPPANHSGIISGADAVAMSADGRIIIIADSTATTIWRSTDFGQNFSSVHTGETWTSVAMSSDGKIIVAGNNSNNSAAIYTSYDYGTSWTTQTGFPTGSGTLPAVLAINADGKYQVAASNTGSGNDFLFLSNDYGVTWNSIISGITQFNGVAISADGRIISAVSSEGDNSVYTSSDYGISHLISNAMANTLRRIAMSSDGKIIVITIASDNVYESYSDSINYGNLVIAQNGTGTTQSTFKGSINVNSLTSDQGYNLPNASGTIALQGDNISEFTNDSGYITSTSPLPINNGSAIGYIDSSQLVSDRTFYLPRIGSPTSATFPVVVASATILGKTAVQTIVSLNAAIAGEFIVGGGIAINSVTLKTIKLQVQYNDQNNTLQTIDLDPQGLTNPVLSTTGTFLYPSVSISVTDGATINVLVTQVVAGTSINYDAWATIQSSH